MSDKTARVIFQTQSYRVVQRDQNHWPQPFYFDVEQVDKDALGADTWHHRFGFSGISSSASDTPQECLLGEIFVKLAAEANR